MKGGFGIAATEGAAGGVVALAVVNALGDVRDADGAIIAGARGADGGFVDAAKLAATTRPPPRVGGVEAPVDHVGPNTTLAVVAVDVSLTRLELASLAKAASAALYRRITPTGTSFDGDVIFAVCPHDERPVTGIGMAAPQVESLAVVALESAIERAVRTAVGRDGIPGLADDTRPRSRQRSSGRR